MVLSNERIMKVELTGMEFFARHGCLEEERREGNTFLVDVEYNYDSVQASISDNLSDAVDYSQVYGIVKREMEIPSNLLENVAYRIKSSLEREVSGIRGVKVTVSKKNPPVGGLCGWSRVSL